MTQLTFYTNPMSRGRIARWMLEESGAEYETVVLEWGGSIKSEEYLAINPMGKVPAIKHGEVVVTEAAAICAYLASAFPEAGLAPNEAERGAYYRWLFFAAGPLEAALTNKTFGWIAQGEQTSMVGYGSVELVLDAIAQHLKLNDYVAGNRFTAADVYVSSQLAWGMRGMETIEPREVYERYVERTHAREACVRANELDGAWPPS